MPDMPCPHCAESHPASAAFCPATGKRLLWEAGVSASGSPKGVADLLQEAFELYRAHARPLLLTCALLFVPAAIAKAVATSLLLAPLTSATVGSFGTFTLGVLSTFVTSFILYGLVVPLTNGALTISVADRVLGGRAAPREVWMLLLSRVGTLLPTVLLAALAIAVGFICLVLPGLVLSFLFAFVSPVVLIEKRSGTEALKRSVALVQSDWLRVALVIISFGVVRWFAQLAASLIIPVSQPFLGSVLGDLITLVLMPVPVLGLVLIYLDIRRHREGLPEDGLRAELASLKTT